MDLDNKKVLIAYFSREGNNYANGNIVNLSVGNTQVAAEMIEEHTRGDLFRIEANYSYPADYTKCTNVAKDELRNNARPELTETIDNMDEYDIIFLGYPTGGEQHQWQCLHSWKSMILMGKQLFLSVLIKEVEWEAVNGI